MYLNIDCKTGAVSLVGRRKQKIQKGNKRSQSTAEYRV